MGDKNNKRAAAAALQRDGIERAAFTIRQFCARNGEFSEGFYRRMRASGLGPRETRIFDRVIITIEAETEWRKQRELESEQVQSVTAA
jgi:hypothetical protein